MSAIPILDLSARMHGIRVEIPAPEEAKPDLRFGGAFAERDWRVTTLTTNRLAISVCTVGSAKKMLLTVYGCNEGLIETGKPDLFRGWNYAILYCGTRGSIDRNNREILDAHDPEPSQKTNTIFVRATINPTVKHPTKRSCAPTSRTRPQHSFAMRHFPPSARPCRLRLKGQQRSADSLDPSTCFVHHFSGHRSVRGRGRRA